MSFTSYLQILVVGPVEDKKYEDRPYKTQSCECILLGDDGAPVEVGVLSVPESLRDAVGVGIFVGTFALRASKRRDGGRKIESYLTGLQRVKRAGNGFVPAEPQAVQQGQQQQPPKVQ